MAIRERGGRYQVRVRLGDGRRIEKTLPAGATRRDAKELEIALQQRKIALAAGKQPRRLIDEALSEWVETSASRLKSYDRDLKYRIAVIRNYTGGKYLEQIPEVAQQVSRDCMADGLAPASINRYLSILRRVGNLAVRWGWTDVPVGQRVHMIAGETARHVYLTPDQVRSLLAQCDPELADIIRFAALTGLRRGEIMGLKPGNLVDGAIILDAKTKSNRPRIVPLPPQALLIAQKRLPWGLATLQVRNGFERARKAAGMPWVQFRDLRHTFASWLAQSGVSLFAVRDLLGHSSIAVTSRYAHLARPDLAKATKKLKV